MNQLTNDKRGKFIDCIDEGENRKTITSTDLSINDLSNEILQKIFINLPDEESLLNSALTSKRWCNNILFTLKKTDIQTRVQLVDELMDINIITNNIDEHLEMFFLMDELHLREAKLLIQNWFYPKKLKSKIKILIFLFKNGMDDFVDKKDGMNLFNTLVSNTINNCQYDVLYLKDLRELLELNIGHFNTRKPIFHHYIKLRVSFLTRHSNSLRIDSDSNDESIACGAMDEKEYQFAEALAPLEKGAANRLRKFLSKTKSFDTQLETISTKFSNEILQLFKDHNHLLK
ncbi:MAG: hypothetical protein ChlgKO_00380 [Chlamydiales bacterium]